MLIELRFDIIAKNEIILLMILDKFLNLQGTSIQGYRHLDTKRGAKKKKQNSKKSETA